MSFSQYGEDDIVIPLLAQCESKTLLDIGAWDPITFSNSRALLQAHGWGGVLIEPSPGPLKNLIRQYCRSDKIRVIAAAVTVGGGLVELEITDDAVSQPAGERAEAWRDVGGFFGRLTVPSISVGDLFTQFGGDFEFVSIDTEGTSVELFIEMTRIGPRPRVVIVEHDNRIVELNQYAEAAHYRQVHLNGTNWIGEWTGRRE